MRIQSNEILAIVGQGYVGLPLAMAAVDAGWTVIGIDILETKVVQINSGVSPVEDISNEQLQKAITKGVYHATSDYSTVSQASVITICVPTPLDAERQPDLTFLRAAVTEIAPFLSNETLVVSESTSYPGTLRDFIIPIVNSLKPKGSLNTYFASAPERVNPGDPIWNQKNTPRLVGAIDDKSQIKALEFYESICEAVVSVSTPEVAEAAKLLENTFRLVNIALVNEFTKLCSASEINVYEVISAASSKPYGFMPFKPGVGVGGHCIPVDPLYVTWWAREKGVVPMLIDSADQVNQAMPTYVAKRALELVTRKSENPKVLIVGVAYKPGVADVRETPVLELRMQLEKCGAIVKWHDPLVATWEDEFSTPLDWDCDVAILATMQPGVDIEPLISNGIKILDCTDTFPKMADIFTL